MYQYLMRMEIIQRIAKSRQIHRRRHLTLTIVVIWRQRFISCVEEVEIEEMEAPSLLVVEATLTDQLKTQQVRLTRSFEFGVDSIPPETGAQVSVQIDGAILSIGDVKLDDRHPLVADGDAIDRKAEALPRDPLELSARSAAGTAGAVSSTGSHRTPHAGRPVVLRLVAAARGCRPRRKDGAGEKY